MVWWLKHEGEDLSPDAQHPIKPDMAMPFYKIPVLLRINGRRRQEDPWKIKGQLAWHA